MALCKSVYYYYYYYSTKRMMTQSYGWSGIYSEGSTREMNKLCDVFHAGELRRRTDFYSSSSSSGVDGNRSQCADESGQSVELIDDVDGRSLSVDTSTCWYRGVPLWPSSECVSNRGTDQNKAVPQTARLRPHPPVCSRLHDKVMGLRLAASATA